VGAGAAAADLSWRHEADVYRGGLDDVLPPGMRMPRRYRVDDLGDDRVAEWLEDVPIAPVRWDLPASPTPPGCSAGWQPASPGRPAPRVGVPRPRPDPADPALGDELFTLPILRGDVTWAHPHVAAVGDPTLRATCCGSPNGFRDPRRPERLPQAFVHGDASPPEPARPGGRPARLRRHRLVADRTAAIGYDLSQLLIGLAHAGEYDVDALPAVQDAIVPAYASGWRRGHARLRGRPSATPAHDPCRPQRLLGPSADPPHRPRRLGGRLARRARVRLTRFLVDIGLALSTR
jgi:hypothetical protein